MMESTEEKPSAGTMTTDSRTKLAAIWTQRCPTFSIKFTILPHGMNTYNAAWCAVLWVASDDIPCLMREGFHFTETNMCDELGVNITEQ